MKQLVSVILAALVMLVPRLVMAQDLVGAWKITDVVVGGRSDVGRPTSDVQAGKTQSTKAAEQAADRVIGTWQLNLAKSKFTTAPPKGGTRTYVAVPNGLKFVGKEVDAAGQPVLGQWTAYYDGKDYPTPGNPHTDTISIKRIDSFTGESVQKKAGKVVARNRRVVSSDGEVMTLTATRTDAQGRPFTNVLVFERR